jgi:hypothetical protein
LAIPEKSGQAALAGQPRAAVPTSYILHSSHSPICASLELNSFFPSGSYKANRFRNDSQFEIRVKRPITSKMPSAIKRPPLATSRACMYERKRL